MSTPRPPLPLSEQVLFWIVQAIGRGEERFPKGESSWTTAKRAKRAEVLRDWDPFVRTCLRALGVEDPNSALDTIRAALRRWDGRVGELPPEPDLTALERLHPVLTWAIPTFGLRLGTLAASVAWRRGTPIEDWSWLTDPFARDFFARVVDTILHTHDPKLTSRQRRKEDLVDAIDTRTYERWFSGQIDVPEIAAVERLIEYLGGDVEGPLRLARLAAVLREDLIEEIGDESFDDWRAAVVAVATSTAKLLRQPFEVAALCEFLARDLRGPLGLGVLKILGGATNANLGEAADALLAAAARLRAGPITPEIGLAASLLLLTQVAVPHPMIGTAVGSGLGMPMLGVIAVGDPLPGRADPWALRSVCRCLATGDRFEVRTADGLPHQRVAPPEVREAARTWLAESLRFRRRPGENPEAYATIVLWWLAGDPRSLTLDLAGALLQVLGPSIEEHMPDEEVAASPHAAALRARRLAEAGNIEAAMQWLGPATRGPAGAGGAEHIAAVYLAFAHKWLDTTRPLRRRWSGRWQAPEAAPSRNLLVSNLPAVEHIVSTAATWLAAPDDTAEALDRVATLFPIKLRLATLRRALGAEGEGIDRAAVAGDAERLKGGLTRYPNRGIAWCALVLWQRWSGEDSVVSVRRAEHWGAGELCQKELKRLEGDWSEDAGAEERASD